MWPPTSADLAGCSIVPLGDEATVDLEGWTAALTVDTAAPTPLPRPTIPAPTLRRRAVAPPEAQFPWDAVEFAADSWSAREVGRGVVALVVAVSLVLVSYAEFRGLRRASPSQAVSAPPAASAQPPGPTAPPPIPVPASSAQPEPPRAIDAAGVETRPRSSY